VFLLLLTSEYSIVDTEAAIEETNRETTYMGGRTYLNRHVEGDGDDCGVECEQGQEGEDEDLEAATARPSDKKTTF
jgi:hypothetical protein